MYAACTKAPRVRESLSELIPSNPPFIRYLNAQTYYASVPLGLQGIRHPVTFHVDGRRRNGCSDKDPPSFTTPSSYVKSGRSRDRRTEKSSKPCLLLMIAQRCPSRAEDPTGSPWTRALHHVVLVAFGFLSLVIVMACWCRIHLIEPALPVYGELIDTSGPSGRPFC